jgi:hypothetical protein
MLVPFSTSAVRKTIWTPTAPGFILAQLRMSLRQLARRFLAAATAITDAISTDASFFSGFLWRFN